jgi:hypothetical protein
MDRFHRLLPFIFSKNESNERTTVYRAALFKRKYAWEQIEEIAKGVTMPALKLILIFETTTRVHRVAESK